MAVTPFLATLAAAIFLASTAFASPRCDTCPRDSNGRIQRSASAIKDFKRANPCPATGKSAGRCPGFQIDHIEPLMCGGSDIVENMQWLTVKDHSAKTARESAGCGLVANEKDRWE